jgi:hypothetical protein
LTPPQQLAEMAGRGLDWDAVHQIAYRCRATGFVYYRLAEVDGPHRVRLCSLHEAVLETSAHLAGLTACLEEILAACRQSGLAPVVLKGAALALGVYRFSAFRSVGDLDLLFRKEEPPRAEVILKELGYHQTPPRDFHSTHHHLPAYIRGDTSVEPHWNLARPDQLDIPPEELFQGTLKVLAGQETAQMLSAPNLLLHLWSTPPARTASNRRCMKFATPPRFRRCTSIGNTFCSPSIETAWKGRRGSHCMPRGLWLVRLFLRR